MAKQAIANFGIMLLVHLPDRYWKLSQRRLGDPASVRLAPARAVGGGNSKSFSAAGLKTKLPQRDAGRAFLV